MYFFRICLAGSAAECTAEFAAGCPASLPRRYTHPSKCLGPASMRSQSADYVAAYMAPSVDLRCFG